MTRHQDHERKGPLARFLAGLDAKTLSALVIALVSLLGTAKVSQDGDHDRTRARHLRQTVDSLASELSQTQVEVKRLHNLVYKKRAAPATRTEQEKRGVVGRTWRFLTGPFRHKEG